MRQPDLNVYIVDDKGDRRKELVSAILRNAGSMNVSVQDCDDGSKIKIAEPKRNRIPELVMAHGRTDIAGISKDAVRILYSGGGKDEVEEVDEGGWYTVPRPVLDGEAFTREEWCELIEWAADPARPMPIQERPRALRADFPRLATALLILCRGYVGMTQGAIPEHAESRRTVRERNWWCKPFRRVHGEDLSNRLKNELGVHVKRDEPVRRSLSEELEFLLKWIRADEEQADTVEREAWRAMGNAEDHFSHDKWLDLIVSEVERQLAHELGAVSVSACDDSGQSGARD